MGKHYFAACCQRISDNVYKSIIADFVNKPTSPLGTLIAPFDNPLEAPLYPGPGWPGVCPSLYPTTGRWRTLPGPRSVGLGAVAATAAARPQWRGPLPLYPRHASGRSSATDHVCSDHGGPGTGARNGRYEADECTRNGLSPRGARCADGKRPFLAVTLIHIGGSIWGSTSSLGRHCG